MATEAFVPCRKLHISGPRYRYYEYHWNDSSAKIKTLYEVEQHEDNMFSPAGLPADQLSPDEKLYGCTLL